MNLRRVIAIGLLILAAESVNGTIRRLWLDPVLVPALGERTSHQIGVLTASALILFIAWLTARWLDARTFTAQLKTGVLWVVLMLCFEFGVGLAMGNSMQIMLAEYDLSQGGLMGLGMLVLLFAPAFGAWAINVRKPRLGK